MRKHRIICLALVLQLLLLCCANPALAYKSTTLRPGKTYSAEVEKMQKALIALGYLGGTPDGIYGNNTERAVRAFQRKNKLNADGLAGTSTLDKLYAQYSGGSSSSESSAGESSSSAAESSSSSQSSSSSAAESASSSSSSSSSGSLFSSYATLRIGATGERVKQLQQALITLKYLSGSADGKLGTRTRAAVIAFQKAQGLTMDGLAGKKTLKALESALNKGASASSSSESGSSESSSSSSGSASSSTTASASVGSVKLLHWYNDIKNTIRTGQHLVIVDPSSGLSWTLNLYSLGRHADAEPLTAEDTATMLKAFGGKNTWNQKAVYVKLPTGKWTIGSTHSMPHMSGSIDDNNFNGHLCVHFLRDMDECKKNDPNYGVANQNTIRSFWKSLTGEVIE